MVRTDRLLDVFSGRGCTALFFVQHSWARPVVAATARVSTVTAGGLSVVKACRGNVLVRTFLLPKMRNKLKSRIVDYGLNDAAGKINPFRLKECCLGTQHIPIGDAHMTMCNQCNELRRRPLDAPKHGQLQPAGTCCYRAMNCVITVEHFRCRVCVTRWEYICDVRDFRAGWRAI